MAKREQSSTASAGKAIERSFDAAIQYAKKDGRRNALRERDLQGPILKRRKAAVERYLPLAMQRYAGKYTNLDPESLWADVCSCAGYTVEEIEAHWHISLAAAIWILDYLYREGKIGYALPLLEMDPACLMGLDLPDFRDVHYDEQVIAEMVYLIQHRNGDDTERRWFINDTTARLKPRKRCQLPGPDVPIQEWTMEQRYTAIQTLIDGDTVKKAVERMEETMWAYLDMLFGRVNDYLGELIPARDRYSALAAECRALTAKIQSGTRVRSAGGKQKDQLRLHALLTEGTALEKKMDELSTRMDQLVHLGHMWPVQPEKNLEGLDWEDIAAVGTVQVMDPYETCFAFLRCLDVGTDMPWLYNAPCAVLLMACRKLPWSAFGGYDTREAVEDLDEELHDDGQMTMDDLLGGAPEAKERTEEKDWIEKKAELYHLGYRDDMLYASGKSPVEGWKVNLPQLIYGQTGLLMPRDVHGWSEAADAYAEAGADPGFARAMELYMELADNSGYLPVGHPQKRQRMLGSLGASAEGHSDNLASDGASEELREMQKALAEAEHAARAARAEASAMRMRLDVAEKELARLRKMTKGQTGGKTAK